MPGAHWREPPYAMMVKIPALLEKAEGIDLVKSIGIKHGELAESAIPILSARVDWPNAKYEIFWNEDEKRFLLDFDGEPNVDEKGNQLHTRYQYEGGIIDFVKHLNLCEMIAGPGQVLAIRQTINLDAQGLPVLEQYTFEQDGKFIYRDWETDRKSVV